MMAKIRSRPGSMIPEIGWVNDGENQPAKWVNDGKKSQVIIGLTPCLLTIE